jgi:TRAP-type uncharacterized transport system fused permease subunit
MPPIMGAGAFLMAEFTQTPYLEIVKIAFIPALLYFFSVILFVHFEAQKQGIWGLPKDQLPNVFQTLCRTSFKPLKTASISLFRWPF